MPSHSKMKICIMKTLTSFTTHTKKAELLRETRKMQPPATRRGESAKEHTKGLTQAKRIGCLLPFKDTEVYLFTPAPFL